MTPKEKAEALLTRFAPYSEDDVNVPYTDMMMAKCCALIAVDEILCTLSDLCCQSSGSEIIEPEIDYWQQVKNEIELL